jgi:hypothetical protein
MALTDFSAIEINELVQYKAERVTITSAQLLALNATPITLVSAPGSGKALEFVSAVVYKPAGTAYAGIAGGEDLAIKYTDGSGAQVNTSLETTSFLDQTTAQLRITRPIVTEVVPVANAALVLQLLVGEITTGYLLQTQTDPLALAMIQTPFHTLDTKLYVDIRDKKIPAVVIKKQFMVKKYHKQGE